VRGTPIFCRIDADSPGMESRLMLFLATNQIADGVNYLVSGFPPRLLPHVQLVERQSINLCWLSAREVRSCAWCPSRRTGAGSNAPQQQLSRWCDSPRIERPLSAKLAKGVSLCLLDQHGQLTGRRHNILCLFGFNRPFYP
jgi:hypothetical protein